MDQSFKTSTSRQISGIFMMRFLYTLIFSLLLPLELISLERSNGSPLPNFVLIVVDDAGLMDFGGYGGEVSTPHVTALGDAGVRFSNYHTSPLCAPTRAMLLTGVDNHLTGVGTIPEVVTPEQKQTRGYSMQFLPEIKTIADKLTAVGYRTYMTGKWHLGGEGKAYPTNMDLKNLLSLMHQAPIIGKKSRTCRTTAKYRGMRMGLARACQKTFIPPSSLSTR